MADWPHFDFGVTETRSRNVGSCLARSCNAAGGRAARRRTVPGCRRSFVVNCVKNERTKRRRTAECSRFSMVNDEVGQMRITEDRAKSLSGQQSAHIGNVENIRLSEKTNGLSVGVMQDFTLTRVVANNTCDHLITSRAAAVEKNYNSEQVSVAGSNSFLPLVERSNTLPHKTEKFLENNRKYKLGKGRSNTQNKWSARKEVDQMNCSSDHGFFDLPQQSVISKIAKAKTAWVDSAHQGCIIKELTTVSNVREKHRLQLRDKKNIGHLPEVGASLSFGADESVINIARNSKKFVGANFSFAPRSKAPYNSENRRRLERIEGSDDITSSEKAHSTTCPVASIRTSAVLMTQDSRPALPLIETSEITKEETESNESRKQNTSNSYLLATACMHNCMSEIANAACVNHPLTSTRDNPTESKQPKADRLFKTSASPIMSSPGSEDLFLEASKSNSAASSQVVIDESIKSRTVENILPEKQGECSTNDPFIGMSYLWCRNRYEGSSNAGEALIKRGNLTQKPVEMNKVSFTSLHSLGEKHAENVVACDDIHCGENLTSDSMHASATSKLLSSRRSDNELRNTIRETLTDVGWKALKTKDASITSSDPHDNRHAKDTTPRHISMSDSSSSASSAAKCPSGREYFDDLCEESGISFEPVDSNDDDDCQKEMIDTIAPMHDTDEYSDDAAQRECEAMVDAIVAEEIDDGSSVTQLVWKCPPPGDLGTDSFDKQTPQRNSRLTKLAEKLKSRINMARSDVKMWRYDDQKRDPAKILNVQSTSRQWGVYWNVAKDTNDATTYYIINSEMLQRPVPNGDADEKSSGSSVFKFYEPLPWVDCDAGRLYLAPRFYI